MEYKCPTCGRQTLKDYTAMDTGEVYYMCHNKLCPDNGKQMIGITPEQ
ncbi:hypothetical protein QNH39_13170 [Neobacillus novalis]|uniref:Uncharacterized protein n=1 Tax=Neobacillus novalis TaxID=220687 RepID=A0AA95SD78_9BACI|nr:hypothetical protein [Neobacillus novalis]WHY88722.1 hypothetical protein QNH39_13170 [Neobacillus novalis]